MDTGTPGGGLQSRVEGGLQRGRGPGGALGGRGGGGVYTTYRSRSNHSNNPKPMRGPMVHNEPGVGRGTRGWDGYPDLGRDNKAGAPWGPQLATWRLDPLLLPGPACRPPAMAGAAAGGGPPPCA